MNNEQIKEEGVIDLLEQLKQEHPELEGKITLIIGAAFDVIDILKKVGGDSDNVMSDNVMYAIDDALHGLIQSDY